MNSRNETGRRRIATVIIAGVMIAAAIWIFFPRTGPVVSSHPGYHNPAVNYGIDVNIYDSNIGLANVPRVFQLIHEAGATYVRAGVGWSSVEPSPGTYDWTYLDGLIHAAQNSSLKLLLEVSGTPNWDLPPGANTLGGLINYPPVDCVLPPGDCRSFAEYVTNLTAHVAPMGVWDLILLNEPQNFPKNWVNGTATEFLTYIHAGYVAAHAVDPQIQILNGGTEIDPPALLAIKEKFVRNASLAQAEYRFVTTLYTSPLWCDSIDILDLHANFDGPYWTPLMVNASYDSFEACNGNRTVPVWVTEMGLSSYGAIQVGAEEEAILGVNYTSGNDSQAEFLIDTMSALARNPHVLGMDWTFLVDPVFEGNNAQDGAGLGLLDASYHPKPSYSAFGTVAA